MKRITILFSALICIFGLTGCVPAPGSSGPGRPIAAYIADDVTRVEITHRAGGTAAERTAVNALLKKYITLGPDIVENAG